MEENKNPSLHDIYSMGTIQNNSFIAGGIKKERSLIRRYFTQQGKSWQEFDIYGNPIEWIAEEVKVTDDMGKVVFVQPSVSRPIFWSPLAIKVVASKYFWGNMQKGERESSIKQLVGRISRFYSRQALKQNYFNEEESKILEEEIGAICLNQVGVFNSPVWFNVGINEYNPKAGGVSAYVWDSATDSIIPGNKGMDRPQCSACFIQSVSDNMDSIMEVQVAEANLFKAGSGTGTNRSTLRSSKERLTGGGHASGPLSFMKGYDAYAGIIKSGGKTRRAAKMELLDMVHPDIMEFIEAKQKEEKKAWALIEQGYDGGLNGEAYKSVFFQNSNMSVRATDEFMEKVKEDGEWETKMVSTGEVCQTLKAREIINKVAEGTWICGDPGMQFDTTLNKWHTCKNSGRINASNPCVTGDTKVLVEGGRWERIDSILGKRTNLIINTGMIDTAEIEGSFCTGIQPVYLLTTKSGYEIKLTAEHEVFTINKGFVKACELTKDDYVLIPSKEVSKIEEPKDKTFYQMVVVYLGDGSRVSQEKVRNIQLNMNKEEEQPILEKFASYVGEEYERITHKNSPAQIQITKTSVKYDLTNTKVIEKFKSILNLNLYSHQKIISDSIFALPLGEQKYVLQGLFTSDGTVANYGDKSQYVALDSTSLQMLKDVQILLLGFGIKSKLYKNRRAGKSISFLPDGKGGIKEYPVKEVHSLRISRSGRIKFEKLIGFMPESIKAERLRKLNESIECYEDKPIDAVESLEYLGEEKVYDLTEPVSHSFVANGITIHNCSEYVFLDDTACNLASINLMKVRTEDGRIDVEKFKEACNTFIIAMDLNVDGASYPTIKIARNSRDFRTLGLGYANLGALLMSIGLPYDSDSGRAVAAAITSIMTGQSYKTSAILASQVGAFPRYSENREPMLEVIKMHRDAVRKIDVEKIPENLRYLVNEAWDVWVETLDLGDKHGYRNAQTTVLAPTGTIAFMMDCDTTGVEPDIALVKYKVLSGGGMLKIINKSVPLALRNLNYNSEQIESIIEYIDKYDSIEGAPHILPEHLAVFDCAFKPANGKRSIHYKGHIKMMGVCQPFISGAISKTINMSESATIEEISEAYIYSWEQGLKAVAIYRENSKRSQPLNTKKTEGEMVKKDKIKDEQVSERIKLPQTRKSVTHKFEIGGHEGYITVGLYDNGKPGEIFVTMHKEGSTIRGLMDAWATTVSLNLQYGIPVDTLFNKFRHQKFEPSGFVKNENGGSLDENSVKIRTASSIVDYVAQFMLSHFSPKTGDGKIEVKIEAFEKQKEEQLELTSFGNEGLVCPHCGGPAKRMGNCAIFCTSCKQTTRNGCGE